MTMQLLARGVGASPGTATGQIVFHARDAVDLAERGIAVIFVRIETTPEDVPAMKVASGIVTTRGGITGDAAIVARSLGKPCIASCAQVLVDYGSKRLTVMGASEDIVLNQGEV